MSSGRPAPSSCRKLAAVSTLFLIRHGQASYGVANYDNLSPLGVQQAAKIGAALAGSPMHADRLDAVYAGPLRRQRDTAMHLRDAASAGGRALPEVVILEELAEYPAFDLLRVWIPRLIEEDPSLAALAGGGTERPEATRLLDLAFEKVIGRWSRGELVTEGVESFEGFGERVRAGLDKIVAAHGKGARVAAVTSGGVIAAALQLALGLDATRMMAAGRLVRNASITEFVWRSRDFAWRPGDFSLVGFNDVHHLGAPGMITYR